MKFVSSHRLIRLLLEYLFLIVAMATAGTFLLSLSGSLSWRDAFYASLSAVCLSSWQSVNCLEAPHIWVIMMLMSAGGVLMIWMVVRAFQSFDESDNNATLNQHGWHWLQRENKRWFSFLLLVVVLLPWLAAIIVMPFWHPEHAWPEGEKWSATLLVCISSWFNAGVHHSLLEHQTPELIVRAFSVVLTFMGSLGILAWLDLFHPSSLRFRMMNPDSRIHILTRLALYGMSISVIVAGVIIVLASGWDSSQGITANMVGLGETSLGLLTGSDQLKHLSDGPLGSLMMLTGNAAVISLLWCGTRRERLFLVLSGITALILVQISPDQGGSILAAITSAGQISTEHEPILTGVSVIAGRLGTLAVWFFIFRRVYGRLPNHVDQRQFSR